MENHKDHLGKLREQLTQRLSLSEVQSLCFDLGVDYDDLRGETKADKIREFIDYLQRRRSLPELLSRGRELRSDISWEEFSSSVSNAPDSTLQSVKILVIDDDRGILEQLVDVLVEEGYQVIGTLNPVEGLKLAIAERPDVVLVDVVMPYMSGHDVLRQIVEKRLPTRVIMMSAQSQHNIGLFFEVGACDFLDKPFGLPQLLSAIDRALLLGPTINVLRKDPAKFIFPLLSKINELYRESNYYRHLASNSEQNIKKLEKQIDQLSKDLEAAKATIAKRGRKKKASPANNESENTRPE
jgi:DNA-binding response OmpR family regulator